MPLMYGPEGQKEWVWPWQEEQRRLEGWSTEPPETTPRMAGQPARPDPYYVSPVEEARRALATRQEPVVLQNDRGFTPRMAQVTVGQPRWVDTDFLGRPIYEMTVTNASGESSSVRRYALDTTSIRGMARFVDPAESFRSTEPMPATPGLGSGPQTERRFNEQGWPETVTVAGKNYGKPEPAPTGTVTPGTPVQPDLNAAADIMAGLAAGTLSREDAIDQLRAAGLSISGINALLGPIPDDASAMRRRLEAAYPNLGSDVTLDDILADLLNTLSGSGSGSGPRYTPPDRSLVEDSVRGLLISLVGVADPSRIAALTDLYLKDDRRRFDGASVDPSQSVRNMIRGYSDYKRIHALRPEAVDETEWVTTQAQRLIGAGVRFSEVDERAVVQAQVGVPWTRSGQAASLSEFQETGRPMPEFLARFRRQATTAMRRVR